MKKTKILITSAIVISVILSGVCTYAVGRGKGKGFPGFGRFEKTEFSKRPQFTEEEMTARKEEMKAGLKAKLDEGKITQEEYNKMLEGMENGKGFPMGRMHGKMTPPKLSEEDLAKMKEEGKKRFEKMAPPKLSEEDLAKMKEEGKKRFEKMAPPKLSEEDLAKMKEEKLKDLKAKLDDGKITKEQYDEIIKRMENGKNFPMGRMQGKGPMPGRGFGKEGHHGFKAPKEK